MAQAPTLPFKLPPHCPLLVVIVNYRSASLTVDCLRSLESEIPSVPGVRVVVVENASNDGSTETIRQAIQTHQWQEWAAVMESPYNAGYAYGNNLAIRPALAEAHPPDYILLLNPDTQVFPGALKALVEFMNEHPDVGIGGSRFVEADGSPWPITFRFPTILSELDGGLRLGLVTKLLSRWQVVREMNDSAEPTDWLPGASMIIRRQVFEEIGPMDEGYFLYYEETDFCLTAKRAGWSCWYIPSSKVMHIAGQSTGVTVRNVKPKRLPTYWHESRRRYFLKNHGFWYAALADLTWITGFALWRVRRVLQQKPDMDPPNYLADFIRQSVWLKGPKVPAQTLPDRATAEATTTADSETDGVAPANT